jgi:O-antigen ligase
MNRRLSAILIEALLLLLAYSLAEHLWRDRAWFYDLIGLALLFVSYLALAIGASLMGNAWRR